MDKIKGYLEQPIYANLEEFCKTYIELSDYYWSLAEEYELSSIEKAEQEVFVTKALKTLNGIFANMSSDEIQAYFHKKRIELFESILDVQSNIIKKEIDNYLIKNLISAKKLKLYIPINESLTVREYYINYITIKKILPLISLKADRGLNK